MERFAYLNRRDVLKLALGFLTVPGLVSTSAKRQLSTTHPESPLKQYVDPDAYSIYATLLKNTKETSIVIQSETESFPGLTDHDMGIKGGKSFQKQWGAAIKDYAVKYQQERVLTRDIPIGVPYELVPKSELHEIFRSQGGWDTFHERFPSVGGYYWVSAVGFNPKKTHAIVNLNYRCGGFCGHGGPHFLEQIQGKWQEVKVNAEVQVWFS
jgi:hypothetical protein